MARLLIDVRAILLQPQNFRRFHLRRDFAANVLQYRVARRVDLFRLRGGAMIHPDNNIAVRIVRRPDRQRRVVIANHHQRAGGIEAEPGDRRRRDAGAGHRGFNAVAHRQPDFTARLLNPIPGAAKQGNVPGRVGEKLAPQIEDPGAHAARTDIHTNHVLRIVLHHILSQAGYGSEIHAVRQDHNVAYGDVFRTRHHKQH